MAIVEDEVHHESEEENEIEVVVEEYDCELGEQDSVVTFEDDDETLLKKRVNKLQNQIEEDPYNYDLHIELIQALWNLAEVDKWRAAFERLYEMGPMPAMHWMMRLQTEATLAHSEQARQRVAELFQQAALDCYSVTIFSEWCTWCVGAMESDVTAARAQLDEVLRRAGADPLSGKLFWDARLELEKAQLGTMSEDNADYKAQQERVLWCLEEIVSRPLLRNNTALSDFEELALSLRDQEFCDKVKKQHDIATELLQKITPYEDKLLTMENQEDKSKVYQEYIDTVKELSDVNKYSACDCDGILRVLYERATSECASCTCARTLLAQYARHVHAGGSRASYWRVLHAGARRAMHTHTFWTLQMQQAEHEEGDFDEVKSIFERALSKGMESYKEEESLWLSYLEFTRRQTNFDEVTHVERLRRTFRLAWDTLAVWGDEANDCEIPLFWARIEYKRLQDPKQGKEIFEEIFKYGDNKGLSKYWEALIQLEMGRAKANESKLRETCRRALRHVTDYPPAVARMWLDFERERGQLHTMREAYHLTEEKIKEWRENYQAMKDKMTGQKGQQQNKKSKFESKKGKIQDKRKKKDDKSIVKGPGKRKSDESPPEGEAKKKREERMEVHPKESEGSNGGGKKRSHDEDEVESTSNKRARAADVKSSETERNACTLFVSNLDFKVDEDALRAKLSEWGEILALRVKVGVKAFGGSICFCQYKTPQSVDEALKHDRTPLEGRPMFLSRYNADKCKENFKYSTQTEKNKLFVKNLPFSHCTQDALRDVFDPYGNLKDIRIVTYKDGKPKGLAYIEYSDESNASEALQATNGRTLGDRVIDVAYSAPPSRSAKASPAQVHNKPASSMHRTQLSSFIPSVLQKPSTSSANSNGAEKRPLSNSDFRNMLLKK